MFENVIWMVILLILTAFSALPFVKNQPKKTLFIVLVELSLILRFILIYIIYSNGTEATGTDGLIYHQVAKDIAYQLESGVPIWKVKYEYTWYTVLVGIQYAVLGVNRYAASFVNAFISILSGLFLTGIALNLRYSVKKSRFIGLVYLFIPSMFVWTSDTRKESLTFFLIILSWYLALRVLQERDWSVFKYAFYILTICVVIWLSTLLRIYMLFTIGGGLLVGLFFQYLKSRRKVVLVFGVSVLITCIILTFTTVMVNMNDYHALAIDRSDSKDEDLGEEMSSIINTILEKDIPQAINGFLTEPHLENVPSITDISGNYIAITIVRLEMVLWYICLIVAVFGVLDTLIKWDPYLIGLLAFIVFYSLINALISESVADTYYRYRAAIIAPVLLFFDYRPFMQSMKSIISGKPLNMFK